MAITINDKPTELIYYYGEDNCYGYKYAFAEDVYSKTYFNRSRCSTFVKNDNETKTEGSVSGQLYEIDGTTYEGSGTYNNGVIYTTGCVIFDKDESGNYVWPSNANTIMSISAMNFINFNESNHDCFAIDTSANSAHIFDFKILNRCRIQKW